MVTSLFIETSGLDTQHTTDSILDDFNKDTGELQQIRLDGGGSLGFLSEYSSDIVFIGDDNDNTVDGNVLLQQIRLDGGGSLGFLSEYSSDIVFIGDDNDNTVDGNVLDNDDDDDDEEEEKEEVHSNE
ncbi:unnamed protein product [Schistosoma margrebowiei]|uniref:Uncharacterized protein n=1 Tax=Schistosoma margrebowiei TaxID=48269 RepID=A0A3P8FQ77_9TREM|nr:unnamed protein product [Schistosoma margrebowiei]